MRLAKTVQDAPPKGGGAKGRAAAVGSAAIGILLVLLAATQNDAIVGNLDDVFVVLHDARGWLSTLGGMPADGPLLGRPSVEGSTSALDVVCKGVSMAIAPGADPLVMAGWLSLAWLCAGVATFAWAAARLGRPWPVTSLATMGFATSLGLVESASYRLEGPLFALLWVWLLGLALHRMPRRAWCAAMLVCLARPEGLALAPAAWWLSTVGTRIPLSIRGLGAGMIPIAVTAGRWSAYGSWAPNAYFAKRSDSLGSEWRDGLHYLDGVLRTPEGLGWLLLVCAGLWCAWTAWGERDSALDSGGTGSGPVTDDVVISGAWLLALSVAAAAVVIHSGGDSYLGSRLALPLAAPAWLAVVCFASRLRTVAFTASLLALALQLYSASPTGMTSPLAALKTARQALRLGPSGEETFAGDPALFALIAGALGDEVFAHRHAQRYRWYEPESTVLDLTGITDKDLARMPWGGQVLFGRDAVDVALERRVGALYLDVSPSRSRPWATALGQVRGQASSHHPDARLVRLLSDPIESQDFLGPPPLDEQTALRVAEHYAAASIGHPGAGGYFNLLVRKDLASSFQRAGFTVTPQ